MEPNNALKRYTTLPVLLDLLRRKKLVLLSPAKWEDRNDAEIVAEYTKRKGLATTFAICFSQGNETIHHWRTFADGSSGCCIEFNRELLLNKLDSIKSLRHREVVYRKIKDIRAHEIEIDMIPFTKRWPYRIEEEYRAIVDIKDPTEKEFFSVDIDLNWIQKITEHYKTGLHIIQG